nr:hypothetical protein [Pseudodesulfovibrio sp.]
MGDSQFSDERDLFLVFDFEVAEQKRMIKPVCFFQSDENPWPELAYGDSVFCIVFVHHYAGDFTASVNNIQ